MGPTDKLGHPRLVALWRFLRALPAMPGLGLAYRGHAIDAMHPTDLSEITKFTGINKQGIILLLYTAP